MVKWEAGQLNIIECMSSDIESPGPRVIETAITCTKVNAAWADHINEDHTGSFPPILGLFYLSFQARFESGFDAKRTLKQPLQIRH